MTATCFATASRSRAEAGLPERVEQPLRATLSQSIIGTPGGNRVVRARSNRASQALQATSPADRRTIALTPHQSARAHSSTAAPRPQNLTSGCRSLRLAPKFLMLEVVGLGRADQSLSRHLAA